MKTYYYIPIILTHHEFQYCWSLYYEGKKKLQAKNLKEAERMAKKEFIKEKDINRLFLFKIPSGLKPPTDDRKQKLREDYPKQMTMLIEANFK